MVSAVVADPAVLWPPNRQLVDVALGYDVTDNCGTAAVALAVTSSEGTSDVWQIIDAHHVRLRSERGARGAERVCTIALTADGRWGETMRVDGRGEGSEKAAPRRPR